jgi:hypothetical protein
MTNINANRLTMSAAETPEPATMQDPQQPQTPAPVPQSSIETKQ